MTFLRDTIYFLLLDDMASLSDTELLSSDASEIEYVALEGTDQSLLKQINKVAFMKESILVSDFHTLFMFDKLGKFKKKISRKGSGPSDYNYVNHVIGDPLTDHFYLITHRKINRYDAAGNYMGSIQTENDFADDFSDGVYTGKKTFLLYTPNKVKLMNDTAFVYSLVEMDTLGNVLYAYRNHVPRYAESLRGGSVMFSIAPLYVFDGHIRFNELANDTIFTVEIEKDFMNAYAIMDFKGLKINYTPDLSQTQSPAEAKAVIDGYNHKISVRKVSESGNYVYLWLGWGYGGKDAYCIYSKKNGTVKNLGTDGLANDLDGGSSFFPRVIEPDGTKVAWKDAADFKEEILSKDYETQKAKYGDRFEKVYRLAQSLKEDDNPVLIMARR
jgi:hypothetical protein